MLSQAKDGVEAVEQYVRLRPDVAVRDVQMPRCSGVLATRILTQWPDAHVVLLTTYDGDEHVSRGLQAGGPNCSKKYRPSSC